MTCPTRIKLKLTYIKRKENAKLRGHQNQVYQLTLIETTMTMMTMMTMTTMTMIVMMTTMTMRCDNMCA